MYHGMWGEYPALTTKAFSMEEVFQLYSRAAELQQTEFVWARTENKR